MSGTSKLRRLLRWVTALGWAAGVRNAVALAFGSREYELSVPGIARRVVARRNRSDVVMFEQVFVQREYEVKLDFVPRVIIDAGANAGYATLFFKRRFPQAKIIAIEPDEANCDLFIRNTAGLRDVQLLRGGLWGGSGALRISDPAASKCTVSLEAGPPDAASIRGYSMKEVMRIAEVSAIDLLKMDIEGAELEVFSADCREWLPKVRVLIVELHDRVKPGCAQAFYKALSGIRFTQEQHGDATFIWNRDFQAA